ncbi:hypothetical protein V1503_24045 [Bacillus sp. SCS-151]
MEQVTAQLDILIEEVLDIIKNDAWRTGWESSIDISDKFEDIEKPIFP